MEIIIECTNEWGNSLTKTTGEEVVIHIDTERVFETAYVDRMINQQLATWCAPSEAKIHGYYYPLDKMSYCAIVTVRGCKELLPPYTFDSPLNT